MKKIPMRMCVVTREKMPKKELLRIVKTDEGIIVDETGKVNGHGCYIKKEENVVKMAKNKKILDKILEINIDDEIYDEIMTKIN